MKYYSFNIKQFNNKQEKVFEISSKILNVDCEDDVVNEIVELICDCYNTNLQLKKYKLSSPNIPLIRLSYPIILLIKDVESRFEVTIILKKFKETLEKNLKKELFDIIKNQIENSNEKENGIDIEDNLQNNSIDLVFSNNSLNYDNDENNINNFTDHKLTEFEVFSICRGIEDKYYQKLSRQFFDGLKLSQSELFESHEIAKKVIDKYGKEHIEFLIELPQMPFKTRDVKALFCEIERNRILKGKSELVITLKGQNKIEDILIQYFELDTKNTLIVSEKSSGKEICRIGKNGYLIPINYQKRIIPVIRLLMKTSDTIESKMIYWGHKEGKCYMCSRKLTDLESVKVGLGPICRRYFH
jgi:hypothetical protein